MRLNNNKTLLCPFSSEDREAAVVAAEASIAASRADLLATCGARVEELKEQLAVADQEAAEAAGRTSEAARSTVDSAQRNLEELAASMGRRGSLLQEGVGAVDVYSTILAKTEQRLVADREFVASEVRKLVLPRFN